MKSILNELFFDRMTNSKNSDLTNELSCRLEKNKKNLKSHLNKKEKRLLLRIIDDKDLIKEEISLNCFVEGFKLGLRVGYESNKD